ARATPASTGKHPGEPGSNLESASMATALQTTTAEPRSLRTPCSALQSAPKLAALVDDTYVYSQRVPTPAERAQLADLLPAYERALAPASRSEINRMIGRLALGYPN